MHYTLGSPPSRRRGKNKPLPPAFTFDLASQLFLCSLSSSANSYFFLSLFHLPSFFILLISLNVQKNHKLQAYACVSNAGAVPPTFKIKGASENLMSPLHEKFTLD